MKKILSCLLLILPLFGMAQKYAFQTYSTEDGLPQTQVKVFCEDDDGYLWVGTLGGLAKFNGKELFLSDNNDYEDDGEIIDSNNQIQVHNTNTISRNIY